MTLGEKLKMLREKKGWTQTQAAEKLGVSSQVISNYERDYRSPDADNLKKLAELYNTTTDYLTGLINDPSPRVNNSSSKKASLEDLDMKENENLFYFNRDGMSDEDIEKVKDYIELLRLKAKQYNENHDK